ncbi:unnamed protein product [Cuscuta europaea]|uniref:Uncharacterized protein n=1 Tax=Cuscuta europaea TaxID=41803 RepID=A0A9P1EN68_CUSEU|nr:unnamed protein product [Cuscuta europaea]
MAPPINPLINMDPPLVVVYCQQHKICRVEGWNVRLVAVFVVLLRNLRCISSFAVRRQGKRGVQWAGGGQELWLAVSWSRWKRSLKLKIMRRIVAGWAGFCGTRGETFWPGFRRAGVAAYLHGKPS